MKYLRCILCVLSLLFLYCIENKAEAMDTESLGPRSQRDVLKEMTDPFTDPHNFEEVDLRDPPQTRQPPPPLITSSKKGGSKTSGPIPIPGSGDKGSNTRPGSRRASKILSSLSSTVTGSATPIRGSSPNDNSEGPPVMKVSPMSLLGQSASISARIGTSTPNQSSTSSGSLKNLSPRRDSVSSRTGSSTPLKVRRASTPAALVREGSLEDQVESANSASLSGLTTPRGRGPSFTTKSGETAGEKFMKSPRVYSEFAGSGVNTPTVQPRSPRRDSPFVAGQTVTDFRPHEVHEQTSLSDEDTDTQSVRPRDLLASLDEATREGHFKGRIELDLIERKPITSLEELGVNEAQLKENRFFREEFFSKLVCGGLDLDLQKALFAILQSCDHVIFVLNSCKAFKPRIFFDEFTLVNTTELRLRGIPQVTQEMVTELNNRRHCPFLLTLDLSFCDCLTSFKGDFPTLVFLELNCCSNLTDIEFQPKRVILESRSDDPYPGNALEILHIRENELLRKLILRSKTLKSIDMYFTVGITDSILEKVASQCPSLETIACDKCPQLAYPILRKTAPLLKQSSLDEETLGLLSTNMDRQKEFSLTLGRIHNLPPEALLQLSFLTTLNLPGSHITDEIALILSQHHAITDLNLSNNGITSTGAQALFQNASFFIVDLSNNNIRRIGNFGEESVINTLNVSGNKIDDDGLEGFGTVSKVTYLNLSNNMIQNPKPLWSNKQIRELDISNNRVGDAGAQTLSTGDFHLLNLSDNQVGPEGAKFLGQGSKKLQTLILRNNKVTKYGAGWFERNTNILFLDLDNNAIEDFGTAQIARNRTLTKLFLRRNGITSLGVREFELNTVLQILTLGSNNIDDDGADPLSRNTTLQLLDLSNNKLTSSGANKFVLNTSLKTLVLQNNNLDEEAVIMLAGNPSLRFLYLSGNRNIKPNHAKHLTKSANKNLQEAKLVLAGVFDGTKIGLD
ncbi:MAG: hypothetical protein K2Y18_00270 [Alphaproteobacteria bacterium]|nr:hypothetical protein [Alphaproteobacteria bacterium]